MTNAIADLTVAPPSPSNARWSGCGLVLVSIFAAWVFFHRLGAAEFTDWDEAWHAQVASEILTTGDWLMLHDRGRPYFNKPPLSFWLKAVAFRVGGVNEASSRFFPAVFGWASIVLAAFFFGKVLGRGTGLLAALILCTSWLFTLYHTGRSGETDSALIFFLFASFTCLWQARENSRWFYAAAIFTALGWMTKGSTAYLAWPIALLGWLISPLRVAPKSYRSPLFALLLTVLLTLPWQLAMLSVHGRAFANVFYGSEGAIPALQVVENHPGNGGFYFMVLHSFFEPWLLLACAGLGWTMIQRSTVTAQVFWIAAWMVLFLVACSFFATKMVWYCAPVLPAVAALAALAGTQLARRNGGWILLALIGWYSAVQVPNQFISPRSVIVAVVLGVVALLWLLFVPIARDRWQFATGMLCIIAPVAVHLRVIVGVIDHGNQFAEWTAVNVDDEPWRELSAKIDREFPGRPIALVGIPLNPAAYFYLHQLKTPVEVVSIKTDVVRNQIDAEPKTVFVSRNDAVIPNTLEKMNRRVDTSALSAFANP